MRQTIGFKIKTKNITLVEAMNKYSQECKVNKLSSFTLATKESIFKDFNKFLNAENKEVILCNQLNNQLISDYKIYLNNKGNASTTINNKITNLLASFKYFNSCGWCKEIKTSTITEEEKFYIPFTPDELSRLLKKPNMKKCSFQEYRTWVIINFLYSTGLRRNSLINLQIKDIDLENNIIIVRVTKNKKQLILPISQQLRKILDEYLEFRNGQLDDYLFPDKFGDKMTISVCRGALQCYNNKRGIYEDGTHKFRHTFATDYIKNGGNVVDLQHLLGHSSLIITQIYINLLITDLKQFNNEFNPLDNFMSKQKKKTTITMKK